MSTNKKATMHPKNSSVDFEGLKLVKNASIFSESGVIFIRHYKTIIFAYNPISQKCEVSFGISSTSNRQIHNAINFFEIAEEKVIDVKGKMIK